MRSVLQYQKKIAILHFRRTHGMCSCAVDPVYVDIE